MDTNILLVDDDKVVVDRLVGSVDWKKLGISMVFTALNIRQARKILEEYPVAIMVSDIEMPQGSGLELLEWIRERGLFVECLFLSSYAYFAYAQKALMLESRGYILKPVSSRELSGELQKLVAIVRERRDREEEPTGASLAESSMAAAAALWEDVIQQQNLNQDNCDLTALSRLYGEGELFCLVLIKIFPNSDARKKKERKLLHFIINNVAREFFSMRGEELEAVVNVSDFEWILISRGEQKEGLGRELCACLKEGLHLNVCIYIGNRVPFEGIARSREKLAQMELKAVPGEDGILFEADWGKKAPGVARLSWEAWEKDMVNTTDILCVGQRILDAVTKLWAETQVTVPVFEGFRKELTQMLIHYLNQRNIRLAQIFDGEEYDEYYDGAVGTLTGMKEFVTWLFGRLAGARSQADGKESVEERIKRYIDQHLKEDLSRKVLAGAVYLSEDYVSKIFMNDTGMSIPNYIAEKRMEKAKEYLENSDLFVSRIALEVGYTNFSYFSKTFRDYMGSTPGEYRSRVQKRLSKVTGLTKMRSD